MERAEAAREKANQVQAAKTDIESSMREVLAERETKLAAIAAERDVLERERHVIAAGIPAELLALYARIAEKAGVGAALLQHGRCGGCQLEANTSDMNRYRAAAADEVLRCEECGRILVRTSESGL